MRSKIMDLKRIFQNVIEGRDQEVGAGVKAALECKASPENILGNALIPAMDEVGRRFERRYSMFRR